MFDQRPGIAPAEPYGIWSPVWAAALASTVAHLLAASGRSTPVLPDALPALIPGSRLQPDGRLFLRVLARLPGVRQPWLRAVYEQGRRYSYSHYAF